MTDRWRIVSTRDGAERAIEEVLDNPDYMVVMLIWPEPRPIDEFLKEAEESSLRHPWRAGLYIQPADDIPDRLTKEFYGLGHEFCAVFLKHSLVSEAVRFKPKSCGQLKPDQYYDIEATFLKCES